MRLGDRGDGGGNGAGISPPPTRFGGTPRCFGSMDSRRRRMGLSTTVSGPTRFCRRICAHKRKFCRAHGPLRRTQRARIPHPPGERWQFPLHPGRGNRAHRCRRERPSGWWAQISTSRSGRMPRRRWSSSTLRSSTASSSARPSWSAPTRTSRRFPIRCRTICAGAAPRGGRIFPGGVGGL